MTDSGNSDINNVLTALESRCMMHPEDSREYELLLEASAYMHDYVENSSAYELEKGHPVSFDTVEGILIKEHEAIEPGSELDSMIANAYRCFRDYLSETEITKS